MTKPTYCPHCLTELTVDDTTCYQCGEAVEINCPDVIFQDFPYEDFKKDNQETPFITKLIWLFCFAVIGGVATAWMKGELPWVS